MAQLLDLADLGRLELPDEYTSQDTQDAVILAQLNDPNFSPIQEELNAIDRLLGKMKEGQVSPPKFTPLEEIERTPDRGYLGEALAGLRSGAQYAIGSGLSGIERIAERVGLDPTGDDEGWLRMAGDALKEGASEIQASEDKEVYFKFFNAFGSILGFAAPALVAAPFSAGASLGFAAALAAGSGADEAYERAKEAGATDEQLTQATLLGTGVGLTEVITPIRALNRIKKMLGAKSELGSTLEKTVRDIGNKGATRGDLARNLGIEEAPFKAFGLKVAKSFGIEGSQEAVAAIGQNAIERYVYNPDKSLLDPDIMEEGLYGGSAGGALSGIIESFSLRKSRRVRKAFDDYTNSEEYQGVINQVNTDVNTLESAEAAQQEALANGDEALATRLQEVIDNAEARVRRANELVTTSVMENVYGGPEVLAYLAEQKLEDGSPMYDADQLQKLTSQQLSEIYKRHVTNPMTKYERDSRDWLSSLDNPVTNEKYSFEEIEAVYDRFGPQGVVQLDNFITQAYEDVDKGRSSKAELYERVRLRTDHNFLDSNQNEVLNVIESDPSLDADQRISARYNLLASIREARKAGVSNKRIMKAVLNRNTTFANESINNVRKLIPEKKPEPKVKTAPPETDAAPPETDAAPAGEDATGEDTTEVEIITDPVEDTPEGENITIDPPLGAFPEVGDTLIYAPEGIFEEVEQKTPPSGNPVGTDPASVITSDVIEEAENTPKEGAPEAESVAAPPETDTDKRKPTAKQIETYNEQQRLAKIEELKREQENLDSEITSVEKLRDKENVRLGNPNLSDEQFNLYLEKVEKLEQRLEPLKQRQQDIVQQRIDLNDPEMALKDIKSSEEAIVTDQKAAEEGVISAKSLSKFEDALRRMLGPESALNPLYITPQEIAITVGGYANEYLRTRDVGTGKVTYGQVASTRLLEGRDLIKTPYGYKEANEQSIPYDIKVRTDQLPSEQQGFPKSFTDFQKLLGVTYHEGFHAAKRLVLTQDQQALLDRVITQKFAEKNGVPREWFEGYPTDYRLEEAQAQIYALWAAGVPIKGMNAPVRKQLKTLKDFFEAFSNWARGEGFIKTITDPDATPEIETIKQMFTDLDSGELARQAGRLDNEAAAKYAGIHAAPNYDGLLNASMKQPPKYGGITDVFSNPFDNKSLRDLGFIGRLISHPSDLAQKNPLFKSFYNALQKRIQIRNSIKGAAVEQGAKALRALNAEQRKLASVVIQLANNAQVEPTIDMETGTVSVSIPLEKMAELEATYDGIPKMFSKIGLDTSVVQETSSTVGDQQYSNFTLSNQPEVAQAVAGVRSASNHLSDNLFTSILHSYLNGKFIKDSGLSDVIRTVDEAGQPVEYSSVLADLNKFMDVQNNPFLTRDEEGKVKLTDDFANASIEEKMKAFPALKEEYLNKKDTPAKLNEVLRLVQGLTASRIDGYFPNYRYGDHGIVVKDGDGKVIYFETIPSSFLDRFGSRKQQRINEVKEQIRQEYPGQEVTDFKLEYDKKKQSFAGLKPEEQAALFESMNILEEIALRRAASPSKKDVEDLIEEIQSGLFAKRIDKLIQPRQNIPGYINERNNDGSYLLDSFIRAVDTTSNTASSLFTEPELFGSLDRLKNAKDQPRYYARAEEIYNYINQPNNEAPITRAFAFHMFLGLNVSSAIVNLTQTFQATYPVLGAITGLGSSGVYVAKALKDAGALYGKQFGSDNIPNLGEYGFSFFTSKTAPDGKVTVEVDMSKKPDSITEDEYRYLAELFRTGVIQPIQNIDLGASTLQQMDIKGPVRPLLHMSGYAFGVVENTNRIAAALAFYRAAKDPKNRKNFEAYLRGTRFGEQDVSQLDAEKFAQLSGTMGVEKTQFYMGQENRPAIMQGPVMSVVTQFQSFLYQMVGLYGDAFIKSFNGRMGQVSEADRPVVRKMAMKQLAAMTLSMMAFGGAMGLPFMENLKEIIKFFTEQFGDQVGEDFEEELRVVLGATMGYTATDALLRGLPRMLGSDVSRRTGYGDVVPLRLLMGGDPVDFAGPAASRAYDMLAGTKEAYDNGDLLGAAIGVMPIAARNAYEALYKEPEVGTFTARGQQLLPAGTLDASERMMKGLGFTPTTISRARERRGLENYLSYRSKKGKDVYTNRMAKNLGAYMAASKNGEGRKAANYLQKYYQDYLHTMQHDFDNIMTPSRMYRINPQTPYNRAMRALDPFGFGTGPRVPKGVRPELFERIRSGAAYSEG